MTEGVGKLRELGQTHLALLPCRCMAFASATTTQLVPTVSTARTCTRTTHGVQQSLGSLTLARVGALPSLPGHTCPGQPTSYSPSLFCPRMQVEWACRQLSL